MKIDLIHHIGDEIMRLTEKTKIMIESTGN